MYSKIVSCVILISMLGCLNYDVMPETVPCESECLIFEGVIWDPNNDEPIAADLDLFFRTGSLSFSNPIIAQGRSNSNGEFSISIDGEDYRRDVGYFQVVATREGYLTNENDGRITFFHIDSTNFDIPIAADILLRPAAQINFLIKVEEPENVSHIRFSHRYAHTRYGIYILEDKIVKDTSIVRPTAGDQFIEIEYSYGIGNENLEFIDSIFINAGETEVYEIEIK